jgi:citrate lyase beta subunit
VLTAFFFIPGNHSKLLDKLKAISAEEFIIDLEDSVKKGDIDRALLNISSIGPVSEYWIRPSVFTSTGTNSNLLVELIRLGFRKFLIPKVRNLKNILEVEQVFSIYGLEQFECMLLVENPECFFYLKDILMGAKVRITGLGFGSQDYCSETGMEHTTKNLYHPRWIIANTSKALGLKAIDIASMDIYATNGFTEEIDEARALGYDSKFVLHPAQLEILHRYPYYSKEEILVAYEILEKYQVSGRPAVFVYNEKLIEPPHIIYYNKIVNWASKYATK